MSADRGETGRPTAAAGSSVLNIDVQGKLRRLQLKAIGDSGRWEVVLDGRPIEVEACQTEPGILSLLVEGRSFRCVLDQAPAETAVQVAGKRFVFSVDDPRSLSARRRKGAPAGGAQVIKAPMPGRIVRLLAAPGDLVEAHQGVIVIEAMKMQNELKALRPGKVAEVRVEAGSTVTAGQVLVLVD